jgi:hypothetical protein
LPDARGIIRHENVLEPMRSKRPQRHPRKPKMPATFVVFISDSMA